MENYQLAFDASAFRWESWRILLIPIGITMVGLFLVSMPKTADKLPGHLKGPALRVFSWFYFLFAASVTSLMLFGQVGTWLDIRKAVADKSYHTVEGRVASFKPMPFEGHADESFNVNGVTFSYSDYGITQGFNNTESHGGPIHANSDVKLRYICRPSESDCSEPLIIRVEIKKSS